MFFSACPLDSPELKVYNNSCKRVEDGPPVQKLNWLMQWINQGLRVSQTQEAELQLFVNATACKFQSSKHRWRARVLLA